jgi:hypothetical protein
MSWSRPLEVTGSKDGMDIDERTRSEADRSVECGANGTAHRVCGSRRAGRLPVQ